MGANKTPIDKSMTIAKAVKQGGYYNTDGDWNCIITMEDYPGKLLRGRVETLVLKDGKIYMTMNDNGKYRIPGGGFDKGVSNIDQAFMETKEEAKIIVDNVRYSGVTYVKIYDEVWPVKEGDIPYDGAYNEVYLADYKSDFDGYIRRGLSDKDMANNGKFYDINEIKHLLKKPHKQALANFFRGVVTESEDICSNNLIQTAQELQLQLKDMKLNTSKYDSLSSVDIESDDGGFVFAQYNIGSTSDKNDVRDFIKYCNQFILNTLCVGKVEEPMSYNDYGFLSIKSYFPTISESAYTKIEESNILTKQDKVFNIDDFTTKSNVLLVTGLSGSGKTTLSYNLAKDYNAEVIQLDYFQNYKEIKDEIPKDNFVKLIKRYRETHPEIDEVELSNITVQGYGEYFEPFFFWLMDQLKHDTKHNYIVEGIHIILFTSFSKVNEYPLICIETPKTKSIIRHWIRDGWTIEDIIKCGYKDIQLFNSWNKQKKRFFNEASKKSNDKYPIFIINTYTGTAFGKVIKSYTHSKYTHSALSFDTSLENLYSFNGDNGVNKLGGFSKEKLSSYVKYNENCSIQVNCIFVNKEDFDIIKERIEHLEKNQKKTKYGFDNLFNIITNKSVEMGKDATTMVCSQFVSWILSVADIKLLDKSINLITPKDLSTIANPHVYLVYEGSGKDYDKKKIDRIFRKLKIKSHLIKEMGDTICL